jgi:hypothetical protein
MASAERIDERCSGTSEGCRRVLPDDDQAKSEAHEGCADSSFYKYTCTP